MYFIYILFAECPMLIKIQFRAQTTGNDILDVNFQSYAITSSLIHSVIVWIDMYMHLKMVRLSYGGLLTIDYCIYKFIDVDIDFKTLGPKVWFEYISKPLFMVGSWILICQSVAGPVY